jgi:hypothetical protein
VGERAFLGMTEGKRGDRKVRLRLSHRIGAQHVASGPEFSAILVP